MSNPGLKYGIDRLAKENTLLSSVSFVPTTIIVLKIFTLMLISGVSVISQISETTSGRYLCFHATTEVCLN